MKRFPYVNIHQSWSALKSTFRFCFLLSRSPCFIMPSLCVPGSGWDGEWGWGGVAALEEGREVWDFPSDLCSQRGHVGKWCTVYAHGRRGMALTFALPGCHLVVVLSPKESVYCIYLLALCQSSNACVACSKTCSEDLNKWKSSVAR